MKKRLSELVFADCIFILFLSFSSVFSGALSSAFYAIAFVLPVFLLLLIWKRREVEIYPVSIALDRRALKLTVPLVFPIIILIFLVSFLTSLAMSLVGIEGAGEVYGENLLYVITVSALAPAIFEDMLFRYLPIRALGAHSAKLCVIYSSVLFALSHCNLFQIPYALVAGVIFAYITVLTGSILPSMLLHFANNTVSVLWMRDPETAPYIILIVLAVLTLLSAVYIVVRRGDYLKSIRETFSGEKVGFSFEITVAAILCLGAALLELR